jgi:hypothetical protein
MITNYTFTTSTSSAKLYTPTIIVFKPSNISLTGNQFLSKMVYQLPDGVITKVNTFVPNGYGNDDCRSDFVYTVPNVTTTSVSGYTTAVISISAFIGPGNYFNPSTYTLSLTGIPPKFTRNPLASAEAYVFDEVHLVKMKSWGPDNNQILALEGKNPNYLLLNYNGL